MAAFSALYIEESCQSLSRTSSIAALCQDIPQISCSRYGEVFNARSQNFRWQKRQPGLILAEKHRNRVLPAPEGYGFGNSNSYYFSHMLNCPYDCRYCFLQGMYQSAHYVLFINYEDFARDIEAIIQSHPQEPCYFYSGYDCDSLALEPFSQFAAYFVPFFKSHPQAYLELRTKSTQIRSLLQYEAMDNCIVAMSFSPSNIASTLEHRVPSVEKRIEACRKLQEQGWPVALRFEPLIWHESYFSHYQALFADIFDQLDATQLQSVSLGLFRMPQGFYRNIVKLYPDEKLFATTMEQQDGMTGYPEACGQAMFNALEAELLNYIPSDIYYQCREIS